MTDLHTAANRLLHCWLNEDREGYAETRRQLQDEGGDQLTNTAHAVAQWQIRQHRTTGRLPAWRREWIEASIGADVDGRAEQEDVSRATAEG